MNFTKNERQVQFLSVLCETVLDLNERGLKKNTYNSFLPKQHSKAQKVD